MVWTSIGGVKVKGLLQLPRFFRLALAAKRAALQSDGCVSVDLFRKGRLFFAVSVWDSPVAMKTFGHSGVHARFMDEDAWIFESTLNTVLQSEIAPDRDAAVAYWMKVRDAGDK